MKKCANCHSTVVQDGRYCPKCGSTEFYFEQENQKTRSREKYNDVKDINENTSKEENGKRIIVILIIVIIVIVCGIGVLYFLRHKDDVIKNDVAQDTDVTMDDSEGRVSGDTIASVDEGQTVVNDASDKPEDIIEDPQQEENENLSDYIGYWDIGGSQERELTIQSVNGDKIVFSIWYYRLASAENIIATLDKNEATFNSTDISGVLRFDNNTIGLDILHSNINYMPVESMVFDKRHYNSWGGNKIIDEAWSAGGTGINEYILPKSDSVLLTEVDLIGMSADELRLARNEIYARHGRMFDDPELQAYFGSKSWYRGYITGDQFTDNMLSDVERANVLLIKECESKVR